MDKSATDERLTMSERDSNGSLRVGHCGVPEVNAWTGATCLHDSPEKVSVTNLVAANAFVESAMAWPVINWVKDVS